MAFLDKDNLRDEFVTAEKHMKPYFEPFAEYERLARNKPHPKVIAQKLPNVTDGRLAAATFKQPKRVIQQLPSGVVTSKQFPELGQVINYVWQNDMVPHMTTNGSVLLKSWAIATKALTYGMQPSYQFMTTHGTWSGADFRLPYVKDLLLPQGCVYGPDAKKLFMVMWWTKDDVKACMAKEDRNQKSEYPAETGWNTAVLQELLDQLEKKKDDNRTPAEREKSDDSTFIKLVVCFQEGIKGQFYIISPKLDKVVRTWTNPDPRGVMPIKFMYADIDLSNPMGRGNIELAGGMQNLLDSEMQAYQFMQRLMQAPPLKKYGTGIVAQSIKWKPNAIWNMGTNPDSDLKPVDISTQATANFTTNYGLMASEIDQLVGSGASTIGSDAGNPSQSKTQAGVKQSQANLSIDDNFLRKQYETWEQEMANDCINLHFTMKSSDEDIELDKDFVSKLPKKLDSKAFTLNKDGTGTVKYGAFKEKLVFTVDAGSTQESDTQDQHDRNLALLEMGLQNPQLSQYIKLDVLTENIVMDSGLTDPEKILYTEEEKQQVAQQQQQAQQQQAQAEQAANQPKPTADQVTPKMADYDTIYSKTTDPSIRAQIETMSGLQPDVEATTNQMDTNELEHGATQIQHASAIDGALNPPAPDAAQPADDQELLQAFTEAGFSPEDAQQGVALHQAGYPTEDVMQMLTQAGAQDG